MSFQHERILLPFNVDCL